MAIQRGEIYFVNLNPVKGKEQAGERPVLVLSNNSINNLPLVVTVVVGTKGKNISRDYPTNVRISPSESGLSVETVFLCFQIRSLDPKRFPKIPAGKASEKTLEVYRKLVEAVEEAIELYQQEGKPLPPSTLTLVHSAKFRKILNDSEREIQEGKGIRHEDFWKEMETEIQPDVNPRIET